MSRGAKELRWSLNTKKRKSSVLIMCDDDSTRDVTSVATRRLINYEEIVGARSLTPHFDHHCTFIEN